MASYGVAVIRFHVEELHIQGHLKVSHGGAMGPELHIEELWAQGFIWGSYGPRFHMEEQ